MNFGGVAQACGEAHDPLQPQPEGFHPRLAITFAPQKAAVSKLGTDYSLILISMAINRGLSSVVLVPNISTIEPWPVPDTYHPCVK
jgi:hypothetical protein